MGAIARHYLDFNECPRFMNHEKVNGRKHYAKKLYDEFQQYYGTSPMSFLRKYRLQQIYKILSHANMNAKLSISKLAYDWGFTHLSRFSQDYKEEFGEKPSETKNKLRE